MLREYLVELFEPSLFLALLIGIVGVAAAAGMGRWNLLDAGLAVGGAFMAQASVNLINDYHDFTSGIDRESVKTRFSGGSALVASGAVPHRDVLYLGIVSAAAAGIVGIYLAIAVTWLLLTLMGLGGIAIFLYTKYVTHFAFLAEPFVMLSFAAVAVGTYVAAHGSFAGMVPALFALLPAGMLGGLALLVNEVPDAEVDGRHGRRHAVVLLRDLRKVTLYFALLEILIYGIVLAGVLARALSPFFVLVLLALPFTLYVGRGILRFRDAPSYERIMTVNVGGTLLFLGALIASYSL